MSDVNRLVKDFPKISIGHCDGMGCGHAQSPCWCEEFHAMKLNFQKRHGRAWDDEDPICKAWDDSFRLTDRRWRNIVERAEQKFYGKKIVGGVSELFFAILHATDELKKECKL